MDGHGINRGLIQFNATPIPTNATIKSVTLSLTALTAPPIENNDSTPKVTNSVHRSPGLDIIANP